MGAAQPRTAGGHCPRRAAVLGMLLLAGCASAPSTSLPASATGPASERAALPPGTRQYQLAVGEVTSGANLVRKVLPVYPQALLASCPPPVQVRALLIMDRSGKVTAVRVAAENVADVPRRRFIAAVRGAARRWQFAPLQIMHWAADADGNTHEVDSGMRSFSRTYQFAFACHAGKPSVSALPALTR